MKNLLPTLTIALAIISCSCDSTEPPIDIDPPGRRDYTWRINVLNDNAPTNYYTQIWGATPNGVWIVGGAGEFEKTVIYFDGTNTRYISTGIGAIDPRAVFGINENDVWFGGRNFEIWHFNGTILKKFKSFQIENFSDSFISDIWGTDQNNLYAVGSLSHLDGSIYAIILHYDGNNWDYAISPIKDIQFLKIRKGTRDDKYYLLGYKSSNTFPDSSDFYSFDGIEVTKIKVGKSTNPLGKDLTLLDGSIYFVHDQEAIKLNNGQLFNPTSLTDLAASNVKLWGRKENDFFIQVEGGLGHFNGNQITSLFNIEQQFGIIDGLIFDKNVYFLGFYRESLKFFLLSGELE